MDAIQALAEEARAFLEPRWVEWFAERGKPLPTYPSSGMCRFSAFFMQRLLERTIGGDWAVVGGIPIDPFGQPVPSGGIQDANGQWHAHYWVTGPDALIVDITADQFGLSQILLSEHDHARYDGNYLEWEVHEHLKDVQNRVLAWLEQWDARTDPPITFR